MRIILHRINRIEQLKTVPSDCGVEIDIRGNRDRMFLNHDPLKAGEEYDELEDWLKVFAERNLPFVIFNTKEAGYEQRIIDLATKYGLGPERYFLLDVEFPYLYKATRRLGVRAIAVRYSEAEPIEAVLAQMADGKPLVNWVWIDVSTHLPLDAEIVEKLRPFKTCLTCPQCWGRPEDIPRYAEQMKALGFTPDAVMTNDEYTPQWKALMG